MTERENKMNIRQRLHIKRYCAPLALMLAGAATLAPTEIYAVGEHDNVKFSGILVAEPCTIAPESGDIAVVMGQFNSQYLTDHGRTPSVPFAIRLTGCDGTMSSLTVTFSGTPDTNLTDKLAINPGGTATGIAIGLEESGGSAIAINSPSAQVPLTAGDMQLQYAAYVVATGPQITTGSFGATATFALDYQ